MLLLFDKGPSLKRYNTHTHKPMVAHSLATPLNTLESHAKIMQPIWSICALKENIKRTRLGGLKGTELKLIFIQTLRHDEENNIMIISVVCALLNAYILVMCEQMYEIVQDFHIYRSCWSKSTNRPPRRADCNIPRSK